jgi:hypothetical protein
MTSIMCKASRALVLDSSQPNRSMPAGPRKVLQDPTSTLARGSVTAWSPLSHTCMKTGGKVALGRLRAYTSGIAGTGHDCSAGCICGILSALWSFASKCREERCAPSQASAICQHPMLDHMPAVICHGCFLKCSQNSQACEYRHACVVQEHWQMA